MLMRSSFKSWAPPGDAAADAKVTDHCNGLPYSTLQYILLKEYNNFFSFF